MSSDSDVVGDDDVVGDGQAAVQREQPSRANVRPFLIVAAARGLWHEHFPEDPTLVTELRGETIVGFALATKSLIAAADANAAEDAKHLRQYARMRTRGRCCGFVEYQIMASARIDHVQVPRADMGARALLQLVSGAMAQVFGHSGATLGEESVRGMLNRWSSRPLTAVRFTPPGLQNRPWIELEHACCFRYREARQTETASKNRAIKSTSAAVQSVGSGKTCSGGDNMQAVAASYMEVEHA